LGFCGNSGSEPDYSCKGAGEDVDEAQIDRITNRPTMPQRMEPRKGGALFPLAMMKRTTLTMIQMTASEIRMPIMVLPMPFSLEDRELTSVIAERQG